MNTQVIYRRHSVHPVRHWMRSAKTAIILRLKWIIFAARVHKERKQLLSLSDDALKDIGISRCDAIHEANKGFLDLPDSKRF